MNNSPFQIPDPWADAKTSGNGFVKIMTKTIKQAVNDNSQDKLKIETVVIPTRGFDYKITVDQLATIYDQLIWCAEKTTPVKKRFYWIDCSQMSLFHYGKKHRPDFSVLFLNSGVHIQHYYICSATPMMELYDAILWDLIKLKGARLIVSTGLQ